MTTLTRRFAICLLLFSLLGAAPALAQSMDVQSVCLVTDVGRVNDGTFNQFAFEGMMRAAEDANLSTTFIETQQPTEYQNNINTCIQEGFDVVVTVGFLIADATLAAAQANPDVYFIGVDQFVMDGPANYVGIQFREDQSAFLVGALAALVTEDNIIGGVFGPDIPPVVRFRNGYEQGIQFMALLLGKDITILGIYLDSFIEPAKGAEAALQMVGEGADVLFGGGGPTGSGAIAAAASAGIWVIGVDQDEYFTTFGAGSSPGADRIISSGIKRVDVGVYDMIMALAEGDMDSFPGGSNYILDVANGGMTFAGPNAADIPAAYYEIVAQLQDALASGALVTGVNPNTTQIETGVRQLLIDALSFELDLSAALSSDS